MRSDRIQITVSPAMLAALQILSERTGLQRSTQATVCLRQALAKTIASAECRERMAASKPMLTTTQRREWAQTEHFVEQVYEAFGAEENAPTAQI